MSRTVELVNIMVLC